MTGWCRIIVENREDWRMNITFYEFGEVEEGRLFYAVIMARCGDRWIWVRNRERMTWEIPGGRREPGETIEETARRELYEESGAVRYRLTPVCLYSVTPAGGTESFGGLFFAEVEELGALPVSEIGEVALLEGMPSGLTYPLIQPALVERVMNFLNLGGTR